MEQFCADFYSIGYFARGDLEKLKDEAYQEKIARCIMKAVAEKYSLKIKNNMKQGVVDSRTE